MAKDIFFDEICDGVLCEEAKSFEDEACSTLVVLNCVVWRSVLLFVLAACKIYIKANEEAQAVYYTVIKTLDIWEM